jgi:hypothetical protein
MSEGDFYVGSATVLLASATFSLVWSEIDASRKERTRERLKERLEGLYSPLRGIGKNFEHNFNHITPERSVYQVMLDLRKVYSYLASDALRVQLDIYYSHIDSPSIDALTEIELKNLKIQFRADYEEITMKYRQLTISETEEKRRTEISKAKKEIRNPR